ncbi:SDR family oxidoreductase [Fictibacillus sp. Mic-4]|uniref:dTDP-4-dehydrorhamnose reductase family protein n=1 Tax=Fictibacillus TaxID=1329200 RepID=UPI0003FD58C2|nr:SDR family oxidoreductase [Fictibacillus gelatini]
MKLLLLGGGGMAGHVIAGYLKKHTDDDIYVTSRDKKQHNHIHLDATDFNELKEIITNIQPDFVINCIGVLNEFAAIRKREAIILNSLLPHELVRLLDSYGGKLIHISTDCVFSGSKGNYPESSEPDGITVYARTKALGEVKEGSHLTIRTSIIGPELKDGIGLFHWFMNQKGEIRGFTKVYWNGVTTLELAKFITYAFKQELTGLYHLTAPEKVSKYELLKIIQDVFQKEDVVIKPHSELFLDRTLLNTREDINYKVPSYKKMLQELKAWMDAS